DYIISTPLHAGDKFTATLDWFIPVYFNAAGTVDDNDDFSDADLHNMYFDQLGLQVWQVQDGVLTTEIADSHSPYNNVDHVWFDIPADGNYAVRVSFLGVTYDMLGTSPMEDDYGLAWSVTPAPEPASLSVLLMASGLLMRRTRSRK